VIIYVFVYTGWIFSAFKVVMQSCTTIIIHSYLKMWVFHAIATVQTGDLCFFRFSFILCLIPYLHFWTCLYFITMFLQRLYNETSNWLLSSYCTAYTAVALCFRIQRLSGDQHETLVVCAGLHNIKIWRNWTFTLYIFVTTLSIVR
jgi:hypothetical protein